MTEADGILYDPPHLASPTPVLEQAVRDLKELPQTYGRRKALAAIEEELQARREAQGHGKA